MRVTFCCPDAMPHFTRGAIGMTPWAIFDTLRNRGHEVQKATERKPVVIE